jgi:hypothetical protein
MIKTTIIIVLLVALLYKAEVGPIVHVLDNATWYWNMAVIEITTFKDRHPFIMLSMPFLILIVLRSMRRVDARV